jgi:hypothetical protein
VRNGGIVFVASVAEKHDAYLLESATTPYYCKANGKHFFNNDAWDIIEHLPDCTGFDWVPPQPPQPKYRPFKDGAEFKPFRDKWVKYKQSDVGKTMLCVSFSNEGVTACISFMPYKTAFDSLVFEDGSPFGVLDDGT